MSLRALWTGNLKIGLVAVPCKLYSATRESKDSPSFKQLHKPCLQPLSQWRVCEPCKAAPVPWEDVVKGKEVSKGQYVAFTAEELAALEPKEEGGLPSIDALQSMAVGTVPHEYVDTTYWVSPEPAGVRSFLTLQTALSLSGLDLFCRVRMRTRPRLCVVHAADGAPLLTLTTVRFAGEIVDPAELVPAARVEQPRSGSPEVKLARRFVREIEDGLDFRRHVDRHSADLAKAVEDKAAEKAGVSFEQLLRQSIEEARGS